MRNIYDESYKPVGMRRNKSVMDIQGAQDKLLYVESVWLAKVVELHEFHHFLFVFDNALLHNLGKNCISMSCNEEKPIN